MPRKKRNPLPKEELKFVESPKFVYHQSNVPIIQLSVNPVKLDAIPAEEVSKKWVKPCFRTNNNNCTTPLNTRWPVRKPQRGRPKPKVEKGPPLDTRNAQVEPSPEVPQRLNMQKYKPITFRGLNDIASDVEDVNDVAEDGDDDDRCLAEKTQTNSLMCSDRCVENLSNESNSCGDALSSGNEQIPCHVEPVIIDLSSRDVPASSSEEETFSNITFETPQAEKSSQHDSSESTSDADVGKSANSRLSSRAGTSVSSTKDSAEESISHSPSLLQERNKSSEPKSRAFGHCQKHYEFPTVLTSPHHSSPSEQLTQLSQTDPLTPSPVSYSPSSPSLLQERNKSSEPKSRAFGHCQRHYEFPTVLSSPHHSPPSEQLNQPSATDPFSPSSGLSPSFTRNPLPILVSSLSNTDCSARSTEQFRLEFFDRAEGIRDVATKKKAPQSDNVILVIPDSCLTSETHNKRSPTAKRCKMPLDSPQTSPVKNIPNDDDRRQFLEDLAEDTPESQQGLTCRMKQVRNRPKILSLVTRATRKIEGDHPS